MAARRPCQEACEIPFTSSMAVFHQWGWVIACISSLSFVWANIPDKSDLRKEGRVTWLVSYQLTQARVIWEE